MLCVRGYGFSGVSAAPPPHPVWEWQLRCNYLPRETLCSLGAWLAELNGGGPGRRSRPHGQPGWGAEGGIALSSDLHGGQDPTAPVSHCLHSLLL